MNSADDIFTNPNGESGMQQVVSSDETKELIGDVKTGTSLVTGSSNLVDPKTYESPFKIVSSLNDIFSGLFNLKNNNDVEENQQ